MFLAIYLTLYLAKGAGFIFPTMIQCYLADLLAIPVVATLSMYFMRWLLQNKGFQLSSWQVIFIILLFSVAFEILFPLFIKRYTGDVIDVLMYIGGGLFFWKVMNR